MKNKIEFFESMKRYLLAPLLLITTMAFSSCSLRSDDDYAGGIPVTITYTLGDYHPNSHYRKHIVKMFGAHREKDYGKLMIVAHADDEILWGGDHLLRDDYTVICMSGGDIESRYNEFKNAMKYTDDKFIMLDFEVLDKNNKQRNWAEDHEEMEKILRRYIGMRNWDLIVTHNPDGEYGNPQHKTINALVKSIVSECGNINLYYFGPYIPKRMKPNQKINVNSWGISKKEYIIKNFYDSQSYKIKRKWWHMLPYENWYLGLAKQDDPRTFTSPFEDQERDKTR